jgi:signal transduction histidine kinase
LYKTVGDPESPKQTTPGSDQLAHSSATTRPKVDTLKAESGTFTLTETPLSIRAVVEEVVATFEPAAREKGLTVASAVAADVPQSVIADAVALRQVLTNLIANAVKFTVVGAVSVAVSARDIGTDAVTLEVAVSDTGLALQPTQSSEFLTRSRRQVLTLRRGSEGRVSG